MDLDCSGLDTELVAHNLSGVAITQKIADVTFSVRLTLQKSEYGISHFVTLALSPVPFEGAGNGGQRPPRRSGGRLSSCRP